MKVRHNFLDWNNIYTVDNIKEVCELVKPLINYTPVRRKVQYLNIPVAFDIETTSFFQLVGNSAEEEKRCIMYVWSFCICGLCVVGRTWGEFLRLLNSLVSYFEIDVYHRMIIYVHNLSFDFSFFRKWLEWENVFSLDTRKPVYALCKNGIEFRCSYLLSGYKLEKVAEHLQEYSIKKLVGDLDYNLLRHNKTPLTEQEMQYIINDVKIVVADIYERIEKDGNIALIPLTKTGYVRQYCRNMCFYENGIPIKNSAKEEKYISLIHRLNLSAEEYHQLKRAFQGGFTHANPFYVDSVINNVASFDFTSSYPAVIVSEKFPMSSSELLLSISKKDFEISLQNYCCIFEVEFFNLKPKILIDNYLSRYRCREIINGVYNNGRIVSADHLKSTITEQDYFIIEKFYKWDDMKIANFRRYKKGYLPTDFIKAVLRLYKDKTELKGVEGKEVEYMQAKEMINSCYGMMVTDIVRDEVTYINNMWPTELERREEKEEPLDFEGKINKYNKSRKRFLFYPWGVWVTAYARRNLFSGILEFNHDYIYSDTDSIKAINADAHMEYINKYNFEIRMKLYTAMNYHKLPLSMVEPKTIKGDTKLLGAWDYEGIYKRFKTLGAKRYMTESDKGINITVAGLNKNVAVPYIIEASNNNPFEFFNGDMAIPEGKTGKQTHTYIDTPMNGYIKDYLGNVSEYHELSGVHLCSGSYAMGRPREFADYLTQLQNHYYYD